MIDAVVYGEEVGVSTHDDLAEAKAATGTTWVRAHDATPEELQRVADSFGIHPLAVEDVRNNVRAKTEEYGSYTFCLVKVAELTRGDRPFAEEVRADPVGVFVGDDWVVTLSTAAVPVVDRVHEAVAREDERLLHRGADFTAYRVIDVVVDGYFELLDDVEDDIEAIEEEVLVSTDRSTLEAINGVRRDLISFRKVVWPAREAVGVFARGDPKQVQESTEKYFRDVYDHLVQVVDLLETYRDLTSSARDIYLNTLSQSTNEVMKRLTVVATVFLPLTFIAGVYGMNFDPSASPYNMPELGWYYGYPAALVGMALVGVSMLVYFYSQDYI